MGAGALARLFVAVALSILSGCGAAMRPFADRPVVWRDADLEPWGPRPEAAPSRAVWDAADGLLFRDAAHALELETPREAVDVNAWDEVPDSSFFTNRIGRRAMRADEVARGACGADAPPPAPWRVIEAKTDGAQPGFFVEDAAGIGHLLKVDGPRQPERATAADAIVAALLHAAGYHVPCNRVVAFAPSDLVIEAGVHAGDVAQVLAAATRHPDGRLRASLSEVLPGAPLGPWSHEGRWLADVRDRVPHELRREVRALRYFDAWVDHVDARAHNSLAIWVPAEGDRGIVRHVLLDFGDCLGAISPSARRTARYGHAHWLSIGTSVEDVVTLGLLPRPWYRELPAPDPVIGDFAHEPFDPDAWQPNYPSAAFARADAADAAWAARIVARFSGEHLGALAALGRFGSPGTERALARALAARRDAILERHLTVLSPLAWPLVRDRSVCLEDLAVSSGIREASDRRDRAAARDGRGARGAVLDVVREGARLCVELPADAPAYLVLDVIVETPGRDRPGPARVHVRTDGALRVIGIERPPGQGGR